MSTTVARAVEHGTTAQQTKCIPGCAMADSMGASRARTLGQTCDILCRVASASHHATQGYLEQRRYSE